MPIALGVSLNFWQKVDKSHCFCSIFTDDKENAGLATCFIEFFVGLSGLAAGRGLERIEVAGERAGSARLPSQTPVITIKPK